MIQWRSIQHGDEAAIVAVFIASVHQVARRDYPPEQLAAWAPETGIDPVAWCAPLFQDDTLVAVSAGRIVGFANMTQAGYLDRVYVAPTHQGQGIASHLVDVLEQHARNRGVHRITVAASHTALAFFKVHGYQVVRANIVERDGVRIGNTIMAKVI